MIETQQLLPSSPKLSNSSRKKELQQNPSDVPSSSSSYGALQNNQDESFLKGEDLLLHDPAAVHDNDNGVDTPQSVEQGGQYVPLSGNNLQNGISPLSNGGLPPAIPLRRRADSSGDRSVGELSTVSGMSGNMRVQRAASYDQNYDGDLSPPNNNYNGNPGSISYNNYAIPPKPLSRRHSRRRSHSSSPGGSFGGGSSVTGNNNFNMQFVGHRNDSTDRHRRSSDGYYMRSYSNSSNNSGISNRHRRTHSYDGMPRQYQQQQQQTRLRRGDSSASLYSLNSQGSMNSETLMLLPDPRWGGGSGGSRARSFSGGSNSQNQNTMGIQSMSYSSGGYSENRNASYSTEKTTAGIMGSYSNDSQEHEKLLYNGYGSINPSAKNVIGASGSIASGEMQPLRGNHRRTNSEVSTSTYASHVSIDHSVEPVMTNMSKSAMFKGVTNDGVLKLQLPKDNFRLLSDRDLGK